MKYDEDLFKLSEQAHTNYNNNVDEEIKKKQDKVLKLIFTKFKKELELKKDLKDGILKVKFQPIIWKAFNDGFDEIDELVKNNSFDLFASEYCIYISDKDKDSYTYNYYELLWDYKTYFEQLSKQNNKNDLPYPIGTYLSTIENGTMHIDQISQYIIDKNEISAILTLDVFSHPRSSTKININKLLAKWSLYNITENKTIKNK